MSEMVDTLDRMNIGILFAIGGDGTLRGAKAIADEIEVNEREHDMIAATGMKMVVFGSVMGVWFQPVDSKHTMFTVLTRRRAGENFPRLTATRFYETLD